MTGHKIAPRIRDQWSGSGYVPDSPRSRHCGKCFNPFLSGSDCVCGCHGNAVAEIEIAETNGEN